MLEDLLPPQPERTCKVRTIKHAFKDAGEEADFNVFCDAIADSGMWPAQTLSKALAQRGIQISGHVITRHRLGECSCHGA